MTIVRRVEIHVEDLLFGIVSRHGRSQNNLLKFAYDRLLITHNSIFDQLLSNRTSPGDDAPVREIIESCTHNTGNVITRVGPEILILDSNLSMHQRGRDF